MTFSLEALQSILDNSTLTAPGTYTNVSVDTRTLQKGALYVALRGERLDGHDYIADAIEKGAWAVLVDHVTEAITVPALVVPDTQAALEKMARAHRDQFTCSVIGVTGSNGKTTVKEMIASILRAAYCQGRYLATQGNLNNAIGVPLTVLRMTADTQAAVVEMGMNHPGEIQVLSQIAAPTVALVNNAQREHQEFMGTVEAVARENGTAISMLPVNGVAVFPAGDEYTPLWSQLAADAGVSVITFGLTPEADVQGSYSATEFGSVLHIVMPAQGRRLMVMLSAAGEHNVRNALAAAACAIAAGVSDDAICRGLGAFSPVKGRLQRKEMARGGTLIDDTYNANPDSVRAAISVLAALPGKRLLILGDMGEVGEEGPAFHAEIGTFAREQGIDALLTLGDAARYASERFGADASHYTDIDSLFAALESTTATTVLVKGSRFMKMERVVERLAR
jgi:UDP-N-acetylmuramoyl-tripeptide--D-alanyl-D-alanine ligase